MKRYFTVATDAIINEYLSRNAKLLYCTIRRYCNKDGECFPRRARLAAESFMSVSSYKRAANELERYGLLRRYKRTRKDKSQTSNLFITSANGERDFIRVPYAVFDRSLSGNALLVLLTLVSLRGKKNYCCPPQRRLAALTGICTTKLREALAELISSMLIHTVRRFRPNGGNTTLCYVFDISFVTNSGETELISITVSLDELSNILADTAPNLRCLSQNLPPAYLRTPV